MLRQAARQRRTQEERSAETRARLVDATLEPLAERGYALSTTTDIAGGPASRAALVLNHHFASKDDLVVPVGGSHILREWIDEIRQVAELVRSGSLSLSNRRPDVEPSPAGSSSSRSSMSPPRATVPSCASSSCP